MPPVYTAALQSVEKPLSLSKNGVWGVAPRQVAGTPVPVFTPGTDAGGVCTRALHDAKPTKHTQPFTGERGQGDRDNKSEVYFKNRLFLQPAMPPVYTAALFMRF